MGKRINDSLTPTTSAPAVDDYLPVDGAANGTRKMLVDDVTGGRTPGANKVFSTDGAGAKGWRSFTSVSDFYNYI